MLVMYEISDQVSVYIPAALSSSAAPSVLGGGFGFSWSDDTADTGSDLVAESLAIGVGASGETGALSSPSFFALSFPTLALPASCAEPVPTPAPARGTAVCGSGCLPVARGCVGGSCFGGTSGLLTPSCCCCCWSGFC